MGRLYSWFALFLQGLLIFLGLFFYIGMHPETTRLLAKKVLEPASVGYEKIEGSLPFGFDLYGVAYQKALVIGHLQLTYRVWELLLPTPMIRGVKAEKIDVWPERFEKSKKETAKKSPPIALPSLRIMHIGIKEGTIHLPERIALDADAGETLLSLHKPDLSIDTFSLQLKSPWASGRLQGRVKNRAIDAKGYAVAAERYRKEAAKHLSPLPQKVPFALKATLQKLDIHAALQEDYPIECMEKYSLSLIGSANTGAEISAAASAIISFFILERRNRRSGRRNSTTSGTRKFRHCCV
jgi:lambda repressor-like predicted transcriptional regulator